MLCISFVICLAGLSLSPVTMGRIIVTVYGGSDGLGRGGNLVAGVGLSFMLGGVIGGSVKCALSSSVYGLWLHGLWWRWGWCVDLCGKVALEGLCLQVVGGGDLLLSILCGSVPKDGAYNFLLKGRFGRNIG